MQTAVTVMSRSKNELEDSVLDHTIFLAKCSRKPDHVREQFYIS